MKGEGTMLNNQAIATGTSVDRHEARESASMKIESTEAIFEKFYLHEDETQAIINRLKAEKAKHEIEAKNPYIDGFNWACQASYPELLFAIKYEDRFRKEGVGWLQKNEGKVAHYISTIFEYVTPEKYIDPWMDGVMRFWTAVKDQI